METERSLSYSVGMKVNVGNYQSVDVHTSESLRFSTDEMTLDQIDDYAHKSYEGLKEKVDARLIKAINEVQSSFKATPSSSKRM